MKEHLEILDGGAWYTVDCRARTRDGMRRVYRKMCKDNPNGPPFGMRIVTVHEEFLGRFANRSADQCAEAIDAYERMTR